MIRTRRKDNDWRSAMFFLDYKIEDGKLISRTACNRNGKLDYDKDTHTGFLPACHTYKLDDIVVEEVIIKDGQRLYMELHNPIPKLLTS